MTLSDGAKESNGLSLPVIEIGDLFPNYLPGTSRALTGRPCLPLNVEMKRKANEMGTGTQSEPRKEDVSSPAVQHPAKNVKIAALREKLEGDKESQPLERQNQSRNSLAEKRRTESRTMSTDSCIARKRTRLLPANPDISGHDLLRTRTGTMEFVVGAVKWTEGAWEKHGNLTPRVNQDVSREQEMGREQHGDDFVASNDDNATCEQLSRSAIQHHGHHDFSNTLSLLPPKIHLFDMNSALPSIQTSHQRNHHRNGSSSGLASSGNSKAPTDFHDGKRGLHWACPQDSWRQPYLSHEQSVHLPQPLSLQGHGGQGSSFARHVNPHGPLHYWHYPSVGQQCYDAVGPTIPFTPVLPRKHQENPRQTPRRHPPQQQNVEKKDVKWERMFERLKTYKYYYGVSGLGTFVCLLFLILTSTFSY